MKTYNAVRKVMLCVALSGLFAWGAGATVTYDFTFSGGGETASGQLTGDIISPGTINVTSGYINGTAGGILGLYPIYPNPTPGSSSSSPANYFVYDNLFSPSSTPMVTANGLLFTSGGVEVNLYYFGGYSLANNGGQTISGTFSLAPVPEASWFACAGVALLGLVYVGRCYVQKVKVA